jgi:HD superfamily phosphohydrolase
MKKTKKNPKWGQIYDNIYGFIRLTKTEEEIINSSFYQRLRWIKQLGFASYIFPGAEHTRFAHAIGAMHMADQVIRSLGKHVPDEALFDLSEQGEATRFHRACRLAALLHDIGTFPFSHSIEESYIRYGHKLQKHGQLPGKKLPNNHEHLGSFIIKNTDYAGGITHTLKAGGIDPHLLSKFVKGESDNLLANQILHSDLDADRMDYLVRDAHHTGIKYGHIDRDYILYHLTIFKAPNGKEAMAIGHKGVHAVEDFLLARFAWYSQVVKNPSSAKFDVLAAHIASYLIENGHIYRFHELLKMVEDQPETFFTFNDVYYMGVVQNLYLNSRNLDPIIKEQMQMLIYRKAPVTLRLPEFEHRIFENGLKKNSQKEALIDKIHNRVQGIHKLIKKHGNGTEWIIVDLPSKDVIFTKGSNSCSKKRRESILLDRDPIKVVDSKGRAEVLAGVENTLLNKLAPFANFIPNLYGNQAAAKLLEKHGLLRG